MGPFYANNACACVEPVALGLGLGLGLRALRTHEWFDRKIVGFNHISGTHNVYFESAIAV